VVPALLLAGILLTSFHLMAIDVTNRFSVLHQVSYLWSHGTCCL
jgi:hypothetical protein